jgi:ferrous iron transport protein B
MQSITAKPISVALIGNPNTGKSTLFSALAGIHQRVGNYPGVTVEKKTGRMEHDGRVYQLVDLPGLYSLAARSLDEMVAVEVLLGRIQGNAAVDAILCVVDAGNLGRNLYLTSQILELGLPTVVALNMIDVAQRRGTEIDVAALERRLGAPVVATQAARGRGMAALKAALGRAVQQPGPAVPSPMPAAFDDEVAQLGETLAAHDMAAVGGEPLPRWFLQRLLLDVHGRLQAAVLPDADDEVVGAVSDARSRLAAAGCIVPSIETASRYDWIRRVLDGSVVRAPRPRETTTDRVDRVLTHPFWGLLVFLCSMAGVFQAVFRGAKPLAGLLDAAVKACGGWIEAVLPGGALRSLMVDGVLGGVGGIVTFLPQILILFLCLGVLEDCGYMARAAFLMDRLMRRVGLSGRAFIPLLSCYACAVPGIMATRVIEDQRDRLATILVAPLMTCSARLPIYALLTAAFIPDRMFLGGLADLQGLTLWLLYVLGIVAAVVVAKLLKRTLLRGNAPPFLLDLPSYTRPSPHAVLLRVVEKAASFVRVAGTMILAVSILTWAALYYPYDKAAIEAPLRPEIDAIQTQLQGMSDDDPRRDALRARHARLADDIRGMHQQQSCLGRFGRAIEPVFRPLGWDWRIGTAVLASFPAREVVVATLGVIFNGDAGAEHAGVAAESPGGSRETPLLESRLRRATRAGTNEPLFTIPVALSILVFFALCAQCAATLAVIRKETNSWRWPVFTFAYMTTLAYGGAMITYQLGTWLGG